MVLRKLERRNYGGEWPVSIKYENLHSSKEGLILLCQSILETRRITHLHGSAHFTIPLISSFSFSRIKRFTSLIVVSVVSLFSFSNLKRFHTSLIMFSSSKIELAITICCEKKNNWFVKK